MKIAILGGGVGAMTAAYWLTNPPPEGPDERHEVTVYQMGWRLGGKGASGRNQKEACRIEEHGLHVWMGMYANAFRMMRTVYGELNRPPGSKLATWRDAFKAQGVYTLMEERGHRWERDEWVFPLPIVPGSPGDQTGFPPPCGYIPSLLNGLESRIQRFLETNLSAAHRAQLDLIHGAIAAAAGQAGEPHEPGTRGAANPLPHDHLLLRLALEALQKLVGVGLDLSRDDSPTMYRLLLIVDASIAILLGIIRDLCGTTDWTIIDGQEWRHWMLKNGMHEETSRSAPIRVLYDLLFAFRDGRARDWEAADLAAGSATCMALRILLDYYEAVFMRMQASMGEAVFTPLYQLLRARGVKFEFFNRLREVIPSDHEPTIEKLRIGIQATTVDDTPYQPLFNVNGIDCWPSEVFFPQLKQAKELEELQKLGFTLEDYDAPWPDVAERVLERGKDFDLVVFGLSVGAVRDVCGRLVDQKKEWRAMVDHVLTVDTLSFQFWLLRNIAELGWPPALDGRNYGEYAMLSSFAEPADTWADMSLLIDLERWNVPVKNIAYYCGPAVTGSHLDTVRDIARTYLEKDVGVLWTRAWNRDGTFQYDWLAVNDPGANITDAERFARQYFRINDQPTEKYVQSVAGSTSHRLDPADTGYENLVLAGDWVKNGLAIGCVESAVLGAMKGVKRFCPGMVIVE